MAFEIGGEKLEASGLRTETISVGPELNELSVGLESNVRSGNQQLHCTVRSQL